MSLGVRHRARARALTASVVLAAAITLSRAATATPTAKLVYVRGEGATSCPGEDELRRAVVQRLGYDPFFPVADTTLVAELEKRDPMGFSARVRVIDKEGKVTGTRALQSSSRECGELLRTVALNLSIVVDDLAASLPKSPEPEATPERPPEPVPERAPPPPSASERTAPEVAPAPTPRTVFPEATITGLGTAGQSPALTLGLGAGLGLRVKDVRVAADFVALLPSEGSEGAFKARASVASGSLSVCYHLALPYACAKGAVGVLEGGGAGIDAPKSGTAIVASAGLEPGIELVFGEHLVLRAFADVRFALTRPSIAVNGIPAYRTGPAALGLGLQVAVRF